MVARGCSQPEGPQIMSSQSLRTIQQYKIAVKIVTLQQNIHALPFNIIEEMMKGWWDENWGENREEQTCGSTYELNEIDPKG